MEPEYLANQSLDAVAGHGFAIGLRNGKSQTRFLMPCLRGMSVHPHHKAGCAVTPALAKNLFKIAFRVESVVPTEPLIHSV